VLTAGDCRENRIRYILFEDRLCSTDPVILFHYTLSALKTKGCFIRIIRKKFPCPQNGEYPRSGNRGLYLHRGIWYDWQAKNRAGGLQEKGKR
jgi:hypothetical protein